MIFKRVCNKLAKEAVRRKELVDSSPNTAAAPELAYVWYKKLFFYQRKLAEKSLLQYAIG